MFKKYKRKINYAQNKPPLPLLNRPQFDKNINEYSSFSGLRQTSELGYKCSSIFPFEYFNRMQSECFEVIINTDHNIVVNAPTGSGKTILFELAILKAKSQFDSFLTIYIAPTKALCSERVEDWRKKFTHLGIKCYECTGDTFEDLDLSCNFGIIIATPEKWDSVSRKKKGDAWMEKIQLFLIDEIHLLNESRGSTLEVIVSRVKIMKYNPRFIAVSATIPNLNSIANWLKYYPIGMEKRLTSVKAFGDEYRPIPLFKEVIGFSNNSKNDFMFDKNLDHRLFEVVEQYSDGEPTLIFCSTRKSALGAAETLSKQYLMKNQNVTIVTNIINKIQDKKLKELILTGVAYHHAGLSYTDRKAVETLFNQKNIQVLCSTSTLAVGVNLPIHLVVIKSTKGYVNSKFAEYSSIDILQMIGRAGRPQFDEYGVAIIMTEQQNVDHYKAFLEGSENIESRLHEQLIEHLNAELCIGNIRTEDDAIEWLKTTYLYVRIQENTAYYKLENQNYNIPANKKLEIILKKYLNQLKENRLVEMNKAGTLLYPTEIGKTMTSNYLLFQTVVGIKQKLNYCSIQKILEILSCAEEFKDIRFNQGEKKFLNEYIRNPAIKFKISTEKPPKIKTIEQKINLIIQCTLAGINLVNFKVNPNLPSEISSILHSSKRICKGIIDIAHYLSDAISLENSIKLFRAINLKIWDDSPYILTQFDKIGLKYAKSLSAIGIKNIKDLSQTSAEKIELRLNRNAPFGKQLIETARRLPKFTIKITKMEEYPKTFKLKLIVIPEIINESEVNEKKGSYNIRVHIIISRGGELLSHYKENLKTLKTKKAFQVQLEPKAKEEKIKVKLLCEDYSGIDTESFIELSNLFIMEDVVVDPLDDTKNVVEEIGSSGLSLNTLEEAQYLQQEYSNFQITNKEQSQFQLKAKDNEQEEPSISLAPNHQEKELKRKETLPFKDDYEDCKHVKSSSLPSPKHREKALKHKEVFLDWLERNS